MSIVLLLQMIGEWDRWEEGGVGVGGSLILGCGWRDRGWISSYSFFFFFLSFVFCLMFPVPLFKWLEHDVCWGFFSLFSSSLVPLTRS